MTNKDFYARMDRLRRTLNAAKMRPATKLVGLTMLDHVNRKVATTASNGLMLCWPSVVSLMAATGLSERSVTRARAELIAAGVVQKVGPAHEGRYVFRPAWADEQANGREADKTAAQIAAAEQALAPPPVAGAPDSGAIRGATDGARLGRDSGATNRGQGAPRVAPKPLNKPEYARTRAYAHAGGDPLDRLRRALTPAEWAAWFGEAEIAVVDDTALIEVPTRFKADWISQRLDGRLRQALGVEFLDVSVSRQGAAH